MAIKVCMVSLGCSKNLVDSERMLDKIRKHGYELVVEYGESDVAVVNTCGFIQSAKEEAIETEQKVEEPKKEEEQSSTSFDEGQQQAINAVLANSGLAQSDVSDLSCSLDSNTNQYTVTFVLNDVTTTAVVDAATFTVISTILG